MRAPTKKEGRLKKMFLILFSFFAFLEPTCLERTDHQQKIIIFHLVQKKTPVAPRSAPRRGSGSHAGPAGVLLHEVCPVVCPLHVKSFLS